MAYKHTHKYTVVTQNGTLSAASKVVNGNGETGCSLDAALAAGATLEFDIAFTIGQMKSFVLQTKEAIQLKTNDVTTPIQTLTLAANEGLAWETTSLHANPITTSITKLFLKNNSANEMAAGDFELAVLLDVTP